MKHRNPASVSRGIYSFRLGDELVLFSEQTKRLFRLNTSAAFVWCCCEEGLERKNIIHELAQTFGLSAPDVEKDIDAILSEWMTLGFLGDTGTPAPALPMENEEPRRPLHVPLPSSSFNEYPCERYYQLVETVLRFRFSSIRLEQIAHSVLGHLEVVERPAFDVAIDVQQEAGKFYVFRDGKTVDHCQSEDELGPLLHGQALANTYSRTRCLIAIHAAAVSNGKQCLVFPALSGSGKSTLTAALVASDFSYCTDELVLLKAKTHRIQAIAMGLGIKAGSWDVLRAFHPHIRDLPTYLRLDGQRVRYLLPEKHQLPGDRAQHHPVRALVFPVYRAGADTRLGRLTPADALCRLTDAGTDMEGGLDERRVRELVDWIAGMDSYELHYSALEDAIAQVRELLP